MSAWTVIGHTEVGSGGAANITFSSIPATYTDLCLLFSVRQTASGVNQTKLEFNGSTSNFSYRYLEGTGSATSSAANANAAQGGLTQGTASTADTFASNSFYIPNYAGTTAKSWSIDAVTENNATLAVQHIVAGLWNQTTAINSVTIKPDSLNFAQYSSATLYGITRGSSGGVTVS